MSASALCRKITKSSKAAGRGPCANKGSFTAAAPVQGRCSASVGVQLVLAKRPFNSNVPTARFQFWDPLSQSRGCRDARRFLGHSRRVGCSCLLAQAQFSVVPEMGVGVHCGGHPPQKVTRNRSKVPGCARGGLE